MITVITAYFYDIRGWGKKGGAGGGDGVTEEGDGEGTGWSETCIVSGGDAERGGWCGISIAG